MNPVIDKTPRLLAFVPSTPGTVAKVDKAGKVTEAEVKAVLSHMRIVDPTATNDGPVFRVKPLDYYDVQEVYTYVGIREQQRHVFSTALVEIDGDTKLAAAFVASPSAIYAGALWRFLWDEALGN